MVSYGGLILALRTWGFVGVEHHGVLRECNSEALYKGNKLVMPSRVLTSSYSYYR